MVRCADTPESTRERYRCAGAPAGCRRRRPGKRAGRKAGVRLGGQFQESLRQAAHALLKSLLDREDHFYLSAHLEVAGEELSGSARALGHHPPL